MKQIFEIKLAHANSFVYDFKNDGYKMPSEHVSITKKCYYDSAKDLAYDLEDASSVYSVVQLNEQNIAPLYDYWTCNRNNLIGYKLNEINLADLSVTELVELKNSFNNIKMNLMKNKIKKLLRF